MSRRAATLPYAFATARGVVLESFAGGHAEVSARASAGAVMRPWACSSIRIESSRLAFMEPI